MAREIRVKCRGKQTTIETSGFGGDACKDATKRLEERLGTVKRDELTDDFYTQTETVDVDSKQ